MDLLVKDIVKIWNNGDASLVAGKEGILRKVEVFDMMEQPNIKPWLREHLILITTGYVIRNDKEALLQIIRDMNDANASALAIKTRFFDDFPKEALQLADELKLPLFFLNNNAGFTELTFPIMTAIVESRSNVALDTRYQIGRQNKSELDRKLFFDIINGKVTQTEEVEYRIASLQWPSEPFRVIALSLEISENSFLLEIKKESQIKGISRVLNNHHIKNVVICGKEICYAIISDIVEDYLALPNTYQQIKEGFLVRNIRKQQWSQVFLSNLQYDRIMLRMSADKEALAFIKKKLGPLVTYDRVHGTKLLDTLEAFIHNNCSRKLAAEALFLHRNTMAHRISKIEEILHCSLEDPDMMDKLEFAIKLKMYIH